MNARKKLWLHIGVHKTATTAIQHSLLESTKSLREAGILYPVSGRVMGAQHQLAWSLLEDVPAHYPASKLSTEQLISDFVAEFAASECGQAIISSEDFCLVDKHLPADRAQNLARLARLLSDFDVTVVVAVRAQADFINSCLKQAIKAYDTRMLPHSVQSVRAYFAPVIDYSQLLARWAAHFGPENIVPVNYHQPDRVHAFFSLCGMADIVPAGNIAAAENAAPGIEALRFKAMLNAMPVPDRDKWNFEHLLAPAKAGEQCRLFSDDIAADIDEEYRESNDRLCRDYGIDLGAVNKSRQETAVLETCPQPEEPLATVIGALARLNSRVEAEKTDTQTAIAEHWQRAEWTRQKLRQLEHEATVQAVEIKQLENRFQQWLGEHSLALNRLQQQDHATGVFVLHTFRSARWRFSPRRWLAELTGQYYRQIRASGLFDETYYRQQLTENFSGDAIRHYLARGAAEGLDPSPWFSTLQYLRRHPECAVAGINPLAHFVQRQQRRAVSASGIRRVLVIDHELPRFDQNAGARHTFLYLDMLAGLVEQLTFIPFTEDADPVYIGQLRAIGVTVPPAPEATGTAYWSDWIASHSQDFDLVIINRPHVADAYFSLLKSFAHLRLWYMCHDLHFLRLERQVSVNPDEELRVAAASYRTREQHYIQHSDLTLTPSPAEQALIAEEFAVQRTAVLPLFVYPQTDIQPHPSPAGPVVIFVGSFDHQPNADGLEWFLGRVWPAVLAAIPEASLQVVGKHPPPSLQALASGNVHFAGYIDDAALMAQYRQAAVAIMPLRFGAGVKGKLIEAMFHGVPIVATACALEGVQGVDSLLVPADAEDDFARQLVTKLRYDEHAFATESRALQAAVGSHYSRESASRLLQQLLAVTSLGS